LPRERLFGGNLAEILETAGLFVVVAPKNVAVSQISLAAKGDRPTDR
jgi:hypothetical protein